MARDQPARGARPGAAAPRPLRSPGARRQARRQGPRGDPDASTCKSVKLADDVDLQVDRRAHRGLRRRRPGEPGQRGRAARRAHGQDGRRDAATSTRRSTASSPGLEKKRVMSDARAADRRVPRVGPRDRRDACCRASIRCTRSRSSQRGFGALGYTMQLPLEDRYLMTRERPARTSSRCCSAGARAEEIAFGEVSTGAQNDLQRATDIARAMVTEFGMSDAIGPVNHEGQRRSHVPRHAVRARARRLRRGNRARHRRGSEAHRDRRPKPRPRDPERAPRRSSTRCPSRLLEKEVIEGDELRDMLGTRRRRTRRAQRRDSRSIDPVISESEVKR